MHEGVEHRLHQLIGQRAQVVVEQFDPLQAVQVLERWGRDLANPGKGKE